LGATLEISGRGNRTVTTALPDTLGSAWAVAVTTTVFTAGIAAGAVYAPVLLSIVPGLSVLPGAPLTDQITAVLAKPLTVAVNVRLPLIGTESVVGLTVMSAAHAPAGTHRATPQAKRNRNGMTSRIFQTS